MSETEPDAGVGALTREQYRQLPDSPDVEQAVASVDTSRLPEHDHLEEAWRDAWAAGG